MIKLNIKGVITLQVKDQIAFKASDLTSIQYHPENDDEVTMTDLINEGLIRMDDLSVDQLNFAGAITHEGHTKLE